MVAIGDGSAKGYQGAKLVYLGHDRNAILRLFSSRIPGKLIAASSIKT